MSRLQAIRGRRHVQEPGLRLSMKLFGRHSHLVAELEGSCQLHTVNTRATLSI